MLTKNWCRAIIIIETEKICYILGGIKMDKFCDAIAELYHNVILGLYDNARDAFHIEYGKLIAILELTATDDEYIERTKQSDIELIYEVWEERYNIMHKKEDK